jgi:GntP family gluconate:H+ symporter
MDPLLILLAGIAIVVGGVLVLRLHAFLALTLGAIVVAFLTPRQAVEQQTILNTEARIERQQKRLGGRPPTREQERIWAAMRVEARERARELGAVTPTTRVAQGFGKTCASIGLLIAMASIIGQCLLESGGADRIVRAVLHMLGESRAGLAFLLSAFVLGVPVFFDTVFLLMIPLARATRRRTGKNYLLYVLSILSGASITHSLAPPTPGPLAVANLLEVDVGLMILGGCAVGAVCALAGYSYAAWINSRMPDVFRDHDSQAAPKDDAVLPSLGMSLLPILLPVVLISGWSILERLVSPAQVDSSPALGLLEALGDKNLAMTLSAGIALSLLARQRVGRDGLARAVGASLGEAGVIILITAAGGSFGEVLKQTGIGVRIQDLSAGIPGGILPVAFLVTVLLRTAQGSSTVAMITAGGIFAAQATPEALGCHPVYLALAIGCGSKPFAWMNDSGFWVICKMSGLTEREGLRTITPISAIMGFVGLAVTMLGARFLPLG